MITRGVWFYVNNWQPVEDVYAGQIEIEHLAKFLGQKLEPAAPVSPKGQKPSMYIYMYTVNCTTVYMYMFGMY